MRNDKDSRWGWALWLSLILFGALISGGCSGCSEVEAGCRTNDDCRTGRICVARVCEDPPFDLGDGDSGSADAGGDRGPTVDFGVTDVAEPDFSLPDSGRPDAAQPDLPTPDIGFADADASSFDAGSDVGFDTGTTDTGTDTAFPDVGADLGPDAGLDTGIDTGVDTGADMGGADMGGPPRIRVTPAVELDFGVLTLGLTTSQPVIVENIGTADLVITGLDLRLRPDPVFDVSPIVDAAGPVVIAPGGSDTFTVDFAPTARGNYDNDIEIASNDPVTPLYSVNLSGRARNLTNNSSCLLITPASIDFGAITPGTTRTVDTTLANCGPTTVSILDMSFVAGGGPFSLGSLPPASLAAGQSATVAVEFTPATLTNTSDVLRVLSDAQIGAQLDVPVSGSGGGCAAAVARAESADPDDWLRGGRIPARTMSTVQLDGLASMSPTGTLTYAWNLVDRPFASSATLSDPTSPRPTLVPDLPGVYVAQLTVIDSVTGTPGCTSDSVEIVAFARPPALRIRTTWAAQHDLDLHLLRSNLFGQFPGFGTSPNDTHYANLSPDWGLGNVALDDAFHYGDDTDGFGPENVIVGALEPGRTYRVGIQLSQLFGQQPTVFDVVAEITVDRPAQPPMTVNLTRSFQRSEVGLYWIPFEVNGTTGAITTVDTTQ